ncbi:MAG: glycosyltransferase [Armatimonadetes bacterium]|nr:glycosyltransferase [Armatimonadota bacterium]
MRIERQGLVDGRMLHRVGLGGATRVVIAETALEDAEVLERLGIPAGEAATVGAVVVRRNVGLGDVIFALAVAHELHRRQPAARLHFVTDRSLMPFVRWFTWLGSVGCDADPLPDGTPLLDLQAIPEADGEDRVAVMARKAGVAVTRWAPAPAVSDDVAFAAAAKASRAGLDTMRGYLVLAPFSRGHRGARSLTVAEVNALVGRLGGQVAVLHTERVDGLRGCVDLTGKLKVEEAVALTAAAERFVGPDSGLLYAAVLFGVPAVGLFTHVHPEWRLALAKGWIALVPEGLACCPCGDWRGRAPCESTPARFACARAVADPEAIARAVAAVTKRSCEVRRVSVGATGRSPAPDPTGDRQVAPTVRKALPRLLCAVPWLSAGGGEKWLKVLLGGLAERADVQIAMLKGDQQGEHHFLPWFSERWPVHDCRGGQNARLRQLAALIGEWQPDSLLFFNNPLALEALSMVTHRPQSVVGVVHSFGEHELATMRSFHGRLALHWVLVAHCQSNWVHANLRGRQNVCVVPNGVDAGEFADCEPRRAEAGFGPKDFVLGHLGRLDHGKNTPMLLDALALLPARVKLLLCGWGGYVEECRRRAGEPGLRGRVAILPATTDVGTVFRSMDAFVLPSAGEAMPYAVMEAMAAGAPVLATRVGDLPVWFRDGEHMLFIDLSPESIADAVKRLLGEVGLRSRLVDSARRVLETDLSAERMVARYAELLGV